MEKPPITQQPGQGAVYPPPYGPPGQMQAPGVYPSPQPHQPQMGSAYPQAPAQPQGPVVYPQVQAQPRGPVVYPQAPTQPQGPGVYPQVQAQPQGPGVYPPPPAQQPPQASFTTHQPRSLRQDALLMQKLESIEAYQINQGKPWLEGLTLGAWPNSYVISDARRTVPILGDSEGRQAPVPVFMVKEESNVCCRLCCPGAQPLVAKVYHTRPEVRRGQGCCGVSHLEYTPDPQAGIAMTLERQGCCAKWLGCFVCCEFCQNDMYMHAGEAFVQAGQTKPEDGSYFARSVMPIGGGGCTPTFNLFVREEGKMQRQGPDGKLDEEPFAVTEGPTCFGGWLSACFNTVFGVSTTKGRRNDPNIVRMEKTRADTCGGWCMELCTKVDRYTVEPREKFKDLTPEQKMAVLGNVIHVDYAFFENDAPPVQIKSNGNDATLICTLCEWYCWGCACPICIAIPLGGGDN